MDFSAYALDQAAYTAQDAPGLTTASSVPPPDPGDDFRRGAYSYDAEDSEITTDSLQAYASTSWTPTGGFGDLYASDDEVRHSQDDTNDSLGAYLAESSYAADKSEAAEEEKRLHVSPQFIAPFVLDPNTILFIQIVFLYCLIAELDVFRSLGAPDSKDVKNDESIASTSKPPTAAAKQDFNARFQHIMELEDSESKFQKMSQLASDFAHTAESYGRTIIAEKCLPNELKTIKPINLGGVAGGDKFIVSGILFKFAAGENSIRIYGNEENAQKIASHELVGLNSFFLTGVPGLSYPLMALVHYLGFCVVAISVLPIGKNTLKYGSSDAGVTMHFENPSLYEKVKEACQKLNLKPHKAGLNAQPDDPDQYGPGDIEGHEGSDGRFYMLDFARLMPPECPLPGQIREKGSLFFQLLRPELVRSNAVPLSSDALTGWSMKDPNKVIHNREVLDATLRLRNQVIPRLVSDLTIELEAALKVEKHRGYAYILYSETLCPRAHAAGINLRHIGLLRKHATDTSLRSLLLCEMVARVFKCKLNDKFRRAINDDAGVEFEKCRRIVAGILCLLLHTGHTSAKIKRWWCEKIKYILEVKFPGALTEEEASEDYDLWEALEGDFGPPVAVRGALLARFLFLTKVQLKSTVVNDIQRSLYDREHSENHVILPSDITSLLPRTKHAVIGDLYLVFSHFLQALRLMEKSHAISLRLLDLILETIKRAPQMASIFYEKLLRPRLSTALQDSGNLQTKIAEALSKILDTTVTLHLSQRPGVTPEVFSRAVAEEYASAARLMRKAGAYSASQWMINRALNFGVDSIPIQVEAYACQVIWGDDIANDLLMKYPGDPRICWLWFKSVLSRCFRLAYITELDEILPLEQSISAISLLAHATPHVFQRKRLAEAAESLFLGFAFRLAAKSLWEQYGKEDEHRRLFVDAILKHASQAEELEFGRLALSNVVVSDLFSDVCDGPRWMAKRFIFYQTGIQVSQLDAFAKVSAGTLRDMRLWRLPEPLASLSFLSHLSHLQTLSLCCSALENPSEIARIPEYLPNPSILQSLQLDGIPSVSPRDIADCFAKLPSVTCAGLPFYWCADEVSAPEELPTVQLSLLSVWKNVLTNIKFLCLTGVGLFPNFSLRLKEALDAAPQLLLMDFIDSITPFHSTEILDLSHPSLLAAITPAGDVLWFSGSKERACSLKPTGSSFSPEWSLTISDKTDAEYQQVLRDYAPIHVRDQWAYDHRYGNKELTTVVAITSSPHEGLSVKFPRPVTSLCALTSIPMIKKMNSIQIGVQGSALVSVNVLNHDVTLQCGKTRGSWTSQHLSTNALITFGPHKWRCLALPGSPMELTVAPKSCITSTCLGMALCTITTRMKK